jgi:hypothetical protein
MKNILILFLYFLLWFFLVTCSWVFSLFSGEQCILFLCFLIILYFIYKKYFLVNTYINGKRMSKNFTSSEEEDKIKWIETIRFFISISYWHKVYIIYNELKLAKFYKLIKILNKKIFKSLFKIEKLLIKRYYNQLVDMQYYRLRYLEIKLKLYKEQIRLNNRDLKYKLLISSII